MPFFVVGPGIESVAKPVSAGSLLPTLLELAGVDAPTGVQYPAWRPPAGVRVTPAPVFSEVDYGLWYYRSGERYVMVRDALEAPYRDPRDPRRCAGREDAVLYDLERDPGERENLAAQPAHAETVGRLVGLIDDWDRGRPIVPAQANAAHGKASRPA